MPCYHPIPAYQDKPGEEVRLWPPVGTANMEIPCGGCLGCKCTKATEWARRAVHEAKTWKYNCFLTLTYNNEELPADGQLVPQDLQKFLKRLRRYRDRRHPALDTERHLPLGLRYLASGEYGSSGGRPHYHLLLFNCAFNDQYQVGADLYESPLVNKTWEKGTHKLASLTGASANYVAQYTVKKMGATHHNPDGVVIPAPFIRMSLKPAIGAQWLNEYKRDLTHGYLVTDGQKGRIPRAYTKRLAAGTRTDSLLAEEIVWRAAQAARGAPTGRDKKQQLQAMERIHAQKIAVNQQRRTL